MRDSPVIQQFIAEAEEFERRNAVRELLTIRFGTEEAKKFDESLNKIENLQQLRDLFTAAAHARRISQFRKAMASL